MKTAATQDLIDCLEASAGASSGQTTGTLADADDSSASALTLAWREAYAAFVGAFDTPLDRRRTSDEFATDARRRLREFDTLVVQGSAPSGPVALTTASGPVTITTASGPVTITQSDRDSAARVIETSKSALAAVVAADIRAGNGDDHSMVREFARTRLASRVSGDALLDALHTLERLRDGDPRRTFNTHTLDDYHAVVRVIAESALETLTPMLAGDA